MTESNAPESLAFGSELLNDAVEYYLDSAQRWILFMDILRKRGNIYLDHIAKGRPPVLTFDYEMVLDGRNFEDRKVNYALVRIKPEKGVKIDPKKRPIMIIDPRAGHGPGIGGFKQDSEIGVSLKKGHPVYLVIFFPEPIPGQTLADVQVAEVKFIEEIAKLHPEADSPSVIGNCQGGWASMLIGADRPDVTGPLVIAGSPLSYWSGVEGVNPMRYRAGLNGGIWLTSMVSDLGNGKFDGAYLVQNFEDLNPANTYWSKLYNVYSNVDTEEKRFLDFERWWGGFFSMTSEEIHFIVSNLFVGNRLEHGGLELERDKKIDLGNLEDPVVMFTSKGDNITPPQQALNWIAKVYGSIEEIRRRQQVLVFIVHEDIGHLGIFVSGSVAKKEHKEIVASLNQIELLPPGLYEMIIEEGENKLLGEYSVRFEERGIEDILALDDGFKDEEDFNVVAKVSEINDLYYKTFISPWVRLFSTEQSAELIRELHPLRMKRYMFSDRNPLLRPFGTMAEAVKAQRRMVRSTNVFLGLERIFSKAVETNLNLYRSSRDNYTEFAFKAIYANPVMKSWYSLVSEKKEQAESPEDREKIEQQIKALQKKDNEHWMKKMGEGGFAEGVVRIMLAAANADRKLDRTEFDLIENVGSISKKLQKIKMNDLKRIAKEQSRIIQTDMDSAIQKLPVLLPTKKERIEAVKIAMDVINADGVLAEEEKAIIKKIKDVLKV